jgi:hypothetical protein
VAIGGRHRTDQLSVHPDVVGRHVPAFVVAGLLGLVVCTVAVAVLAAADGARHPVTWASTVVAVVILVGGPRLMGVIRRRAVRSASGA